MTDIDDESGRVEIAPPKRVRDVLSGLPAQPPHGARGSMIDAAVEWAVGQRYEETMMACPRCGEPVFISLNATLPAPWSCANCGAHGQVEETP